MGEVLWRWWCLCCVCLAVVAVAAEQQTPCEVLDSGGLRSTLLVPTNLTMRSLTQQWQLQFYLLGERGKPIPPTCFLMDQQDSAVQFRIFLGSCEGGPQQGHILIEGMSLSPHAWTLFQVDFRDQAVWVTPSGAAPVALRGKGIFVPSKGALQVTASMGVEVAVGCQPAPLCPHYNHSSGRGRKKTVRRFPQEEVFFYFRPAKDFVRLQYEVTCTNPEGLTFYPHVSDIVPPGNADCGRWHLVELRHLAGAAQITLNKPLLRKDLPPQCAFVEHTIRIEGQGIFTFFCNPDSDEAEWGVNAMTQCSGNICSVTDQTQWYQSMVMVVTVVVVVVIFLVVYHWGVQRAWERGRRELMTHKAE